MKQGGLVLPRKPRKEEDESDEDFAIRLNAYKETKAQYKLLKRNYYDFGNKLPRPNTVVGEVRAYPFNSESAESRVILTRMKVIEGEVHFDSELMPTDLPVGGEGSDSLDFNGEAVVFSKSSSCDEAPCTCTKGTDCGAGAYCQGEICVASCTGFGADENRTCYTSCFTDSQCPEGYFCDSGLCTTTKTCLTYLDCPTSRPYCNNRECSATQILTCDSTDTMPTDTWIAGWANCTSCPPGQFKKYQVTWENGGNCSYPVAHSAGCVNIPPLNGYTTMPTGGYYAGSWGTYSNLNVWHRQVNITCNGKNEEWDLVGPFINWWEANEICTKLGKVLPANASVLTGGCSEGARWSLIANATAVGTGQTLKAVSGIVNAKCSWNSSTGNVTSSYHWVLTNQDWGTSCPVWLVFMSTGSTAEANRGAADCNRYILCGPAM